MYELVGSLTYKLMMSSTISTEEANKKIDEVFADEIAEMQND